MSSTAGEQRLGSTLDLCITDAIIKLGGGASVGGIVSLLFIRRKWPILVGAGIGLGMAYARCEKSVNDIFRNPVSS